MGGTVSALLQRLRRPEAMRHQVLLYLFLSRVHNSIRLSYEQYLANERALGRSRQRQAQQKGSLVDELSKKNKSNSNRNRIKVAPAEENERASKQTRSDSQANHEEGTRHNYYSWEWRGFPRMWRPFALHELVANCWMVYASARALLLDQFEHLLDPISLELFGVPSNCLLMGRIAVPFAISQLLSVLFAGYHLVWRFVQDNSKRNRLLTLVIFLLASDKDVEHFYALLEEDDTLKSSLTVEKNSLLSGDSPFTFSSSSSSSSALQASNFQEPTRSKRAPEVPPATCLLPLPPPPSPSPSPPRQMSEIECLLRQAMCYKVGSFAENNRAYYKLRPNRSRAARRQLMSQLALVTLVIFAWFMLEFLVAFSLIFYTCLSDYRYAILYPGCSTQFDERLKRGELSHWPLSVTLNAHRLISGIIFDGLENLILWGESGLALAFVPAFAYWLNFDLLLYWSHLNHRLELLLARSIQEFHFTAHQQENQQQQQQHNGQKLMPTIYRSTTGAKQVDMWTPSTGSQLHDPWAAPQLPFLSRKSQLLASSTSSGTSTRRHYVQGLVESSVTADAARIHSILRLERDIHELQAEIFDFFQQAKRADLIIGDALTMFIVIWLTYCAFFNYNLLLKADSSPVVWSILLLGFFVISLTSYLMFELRRRCRTSHRLLCSMMAYDQTRKKRAFIGLLDFYLNRDASTYHLCRSYPYRPTTFITIIGWSFSLFFVAYTLLSPEGKRAA